MPATGENLAHDLPCVRCGYNLRGLSPDGRCPECGADVCASLVDPGIKPLTHSNPAWVRTVREALLLLLAAAASEIAVSAGVVPYRHNHLDVIAAAVANVLACYGVWKLAAPERDERGRAENVAIRSFMRAGAVAWLCFLPAAEMTREIGGAIIVVMIVAIIGAAVMTFTSILYLSSLALRLRRRAVSFQLLALSVLIGLTLPWLVLSARLASFRTNPQPPLGDVRSILVLGEELNRILRFPARDIIRTLPYVIFGPVVSAWLCVLLAVVWWRLSAVVRAHAGRSSASSRP